MMKSAFCTASQPGYCRKSARRVTQKAAAADTSVMTATASSQLHAGIAGTAEPRELGSTVAGSGAVTLGGNRSQRALGRADAQRSIRALRVASSVSDENTAATRKRRCVEVRFRTTTR